MQISDVQRYLRKLKVGFGKPTPEDLARTTPLYVSVVYQAFAMRIEETPSLILLVERSGITPADVISHQRALAVAYPVMIVFVFRRATREFCETLRTNSIRFIVPGWLVNLPPDIVLLGNKGYAQAISPRAHLSACAQLVFLWHLLHDRGECELPFAALRERLGLNKVYVSRVADELENFDLANVRRNGREKSIVFAAAGRELWRLASSRLRSPVQCRVRTDHVPAKRPLFGGISALSRRSMLNDDRQPTFAFWRRDPVLRELGVRQYDGVEIEEWRYDPKLLVGARDVVVDPLSLHLSLRDNPDPRIQDALSVILEEVPW